MEIARIRFIVACDDSIILEEPDSAYRSFLADRTSKSGIADIHVRLDLAPPPDEGALKEVFDGGRSWSMFQSGDGYFMRLSGAEGEKQPVWQARASHDFRHVTVYYSDTDKPADMRNSPVTVPYPIRYPLDQILLMHVLANGRGAVVHAAGLDLNGRGFIFPGRSGDGKSTLSMLFAERKETALLSDDRVIVREIDGTFEAFGTPWPSDAGMALNRGVPLSGIFFIHHGHANVIRKISPREALERLLPMVSIPWYDEEAMPKVLHFCEDLIYGIPAYELHFKPAVELAYTFEKIIPA